MPAGNLVLQISLGRLVEVSILVLVDACRKQTNAIPTMQADIGFQSLFSWMPAGNTYYMRADGTAAKFQSLFSWMPAGNLDTTRCLTAILRFNPCSRGCLPETKRHIPHMLRDVGFQSLFSWMPAGNPGCIHRCNCRWPVSILVLVDACRKPNPPGGCMFPTRFQSLFSWMPAGNSISAKRFEALITYLFSHSALLNLPEGLSSASTPFFLSTEKT